MTFPHEYTEKGAAVFKKFMQQGYEAEYYKAAKKLLERADEARRLIGDVPPEVEANLGRVVVHEVIGEQQFHLYQNHGWKLQSADSPSYGQLFRHRFMEIDTAVLRAQLEAHELANA